MTCNVCSTVAAPTLCQSTVLLLRILCCGGAGRPKKTKKNKSLSEVLSPYIPPCVPKTPFGCQLPCFPTTGMPLCTVPAYVFVHTIRRYVNKKVRLCASIRPRLMPDFSSKCQYLKKRNVPTTAQTVRARKKQMQNFEPRTKHILCLSPPIKQTLNRDHNKRASRSKKTSFVFKRLRGARLQINANVASCLLRHFHNTFMKAVSTVLSV